MPNIHKRKSYYYEKANFKCTTMTDLQHRVAAVKYHQMDSPLYLYQHQKLQLHLVAFDALSKETQWQTKIITKP